MKYMMPIEDKRMIGAIGEYLKEKNERDYVLWLCGIYLGRRIGDILQYRVGDLRGKDRISIKERKTGKEIMLAVNPHLQKALEHYFIGKKDTEFVFRANGTENKPISRVRAWQILNEAAAACGLNGSIGCHTMRKTFGYYLYRNTKGDIVLVQELLGHSDPGVTRRYIGIDQEKKDDAVCKLDFR